ncbi:hypothetical protein S144_10 [Shewanella sp. phage 1/44]|uniref:hypothetical protein n=1 Tax=Shewanella sp. phage 1/44 TaxID=1458862 RepID=UPI0004F6D668|nr:hypothetical protein S144_10 [Shewanella sp. phage 1/44]AHK11725.1 hypothetical protein S144_10 [Shewanella sp. phage 1/44]
MVNLTNEITVSKFNKHSRVIYSIASGTGSHRYYLSKSSASEIMVRIARQLELIKAIGVIEYDDLDLTPTFIKSEAGTTYSLLTLPIGY